MIPIQSEDLPKDSLHGNDGNKKITFLGPFMNLAHLSLTAFLALPGVDPFLDLPGKEKDKYYVIQVKVVHRFLFHANNVEFMERNLAQWKKAPFYQLASTPEYLLGFLLEKMEDQYIFYPLGKTKKYCWQKGTHDLNRLGGRAAFALEKILDIQLRKITPESTKEDLENVYREAKPAVKAFLNSAINKSVGIKTEKIEVLKARYRGKIKPGITGEKAFDYDKAMGQLLQEWPPLGRKMSDLQEIIGHPPSSTCKDYVTYSFDTGFIGVAYRFWIKEGLIRSVMLR